MADPLGVGSVAEQPGAELPDDGLRRGLGAYSATALVAGSMIGSGIFLVTPGMARQLGSPGWVLAAWVLTVLLTVAAALSYGELGAMMPRAGGAYVYLREGLSPLWAFLYGWTLFLVNQTGSIAALGVAFARFTGVLLPGVAEDNYLVPPLHVTDHYALSVSTAQLVALAVIALLTWTNTRGLEAGKNVQNVFTTTNAAALLALVAAGLLVGWNREAVAANFADPWTARGVEPIVSGLTAATAFGLVVALCVSQTGSFFSATGWDNLPLAAGEVRRPARNLPLALAAGTALVLALYLLANVAYLVTLPFAELQTVPGDRVGSAVLERILPGIGAGVMAGAIMVSTFGCNNAQILAGARAYYAMARDGLFLAGAGKLNRARVPARALVLQGAWAGALVIPRTYDPTTGAYGNLYGNLLDYVVTIALLFYLLTVAGLFRLRRTRPGAERPYRVTGYPFVPGFFLAVGSIVLVILCAYRPYTTWPGLVLLLLGVPVYLIRRRSSGPAPVTPHG